MAAKRRSRVAVVLKRTSYRKFVVEEDDPLITKLLRRKDPTVRRLKQSHEAHEETVREVERALTALGVDVIFRGGPRFRLPRADLVVTVGGDGTMLAASHQIGDGTPVLAINSAPESSVGFFCGAEKGEVARALRLALEGKLPRTELTRMRVEINGRLIHARVLNEALVCHASPAATSRYVLSVDGVSGVVREEDQRSSGIWVGPAAGSTAAQRSAGGRVFPLSSNKLQYVVREPYTPAGGRFRYAKGFVMPGGWLTLRSKMRDGRVFLDGHRIVHEVTMGDVLTLRASTDALTVLGIAGKRRT